MFLARYADVAPWEELARTLDAPPRGGKYHAFTDYPVGDYYQLVDRAARARHARVSTRQGYRLLGRSEVDVFRKTTIGGVTFSISDDPLTMIERYPAVLRVVARGVRGSATRDAKTVTLRLDVFVGSIEATVGILEGIALELRAKPRIEVVVDAPAVTLVVSVA